MPTMANITVKKYDGTTDVVYTAVAGSAGDTVPAIWRNLTVGTAQGHKPQLVMSARNNGNNTARRTSLDFMYPSLVTDAGVTKIGDKATFSLTGSLPLNMPDAERREAVYQFLNLCASTMLKQSNDEGFAPRG